MDIDDILEIDAFDPHAHRAKLLLDADRKLIADLVARRKELGLTQTEVGARMDSDQSTVAKIEAGGRDLHQSTLRRYAMAVDALIEHRVIAPRSSKVSRAHIAAASANPPASWSATPSGLARLPKAGRLREAPRG